MTKADFHRTVGAIKPSQFVDYKEYLEKSFRLADEKYRSYSYFKFAEDLGFGHTNLVYQIIRGLRPLTVKTGRRIATGLGLIGSERRYFLAMVEYNGLEDGPEKQEAFVRLTQAKSLTVPNEVDKLYLDFFGKWYHPLILEMSSLAEFEPTPEWISAKAYPRLEKEQVEESLDLLTKIGFLAEDPKTGKLVRMEKDISTGEDVMGMAFIRYHQHMIELAKESLMSVEPWDREIGAASVLADEELFEKMRVEFQNFRKKVFAMSCTKPDRVMQLNLQLFPLTKIPRSSE